MSMPRTFAQALQSVMDAKGVKPVDLSKKARIHQSNLSGLMKQQFPPRQITIRKLSTALDCDPLDLLDDVITEWGLPLSREMVVENSRAPAAGRRSVKKRRAGSG